MPDQPATAARWAVVDVSNDDIPEAWKRERVTATFRTWIGAHWKRWLWVQRHKREGCWPECSTLWHYEVRRAPPRLPGPQPRDPDEPTATAALEAYAAMEAKKHKPEQGGGCICGFCAWSIEHVVIMSIRDGWPLAVRDQQLANNPVVQQLVALDRAGELEFTEVPDGT